MNMITPLRFELYKEKPPLFEAVQLREENRNAVLSWCDGQGHFGPDGAWWISIDRLSSRGESRVFPGEYIIKLPQIGFIALSEANFKVRYEAV